MNVVVSITFWDGPEGLPADLDVALYDLDTDHNNCSSPQPNVVEKTLAGDTYQEKFGEDFSKAKGFGFQIHRGECCLLILKSLSFHFLIVLLVDLVLYF